MTEHVHEWFYPRNVVVAYCRKCDAIMGIAEQERRLNAAQKIIDAPDEVEAGIEIIKFWTEYRSNILEGKDE